MGLLETWHHHAHEIEDEKYQSEFWQAYFDVEKGIYGDVLNNPGEIVKGTVSGLADHFKASLLHFTGFLDGINDSLKEPLELEELEEDSNIEFEIDLEELYYNMLEAKADWLYGLPEWNNILTEEKKKEITKEQRLSGTFIREEKIGRNEPCICGSGKKYKKCCGANV